MDEFRKKLMIPDYEISKCPEHEVKQKQGAYLQTKKYLKKNLSGFMKLILIFMSIIKKKTS